MNNQVYSAITVQFSYNSLINCNNLVILKLIKLCLNMKELIKRYIYLH